MKAALDANVLLRYITNDDPAQSRRAVSFIDGAAQGKVEIVITPPVLFEVAWTLRRVYQFPREEILKVFDALLGTTGITLSDAKTVEKSIAIARDSGVEFADAYIAAAAKGLGIDKVATFNVKDLKKAGMELVVM